MHEEKIWALDFVEKMSEDEGVHQLKMITGAGDSRVKVWSDSTVEQQEKDNQEKLDRIAQELTLSNMLRDNDLVQASLLAFKLNKLRDFFHAMDRLVSGRVAQNRPFVPGMHNAPVLDKSLDPVESIL